MSFAASTSTGAASSSTSISTSGSTSSSFFSSSFSLRQEHYSLFFPHTRHFQASENLDSPPPSLAP